MLYIFFKWQAFVQGCLSSNLCTPGNVLGQHPRTCRQTNTSTIIISLFTCRSSSNAITCSTLVSKRGLWGVAMVTRSNEESRMISGAAGLCPQAAVVSNPPPPPSTKADGLTNWRPLTRGDWPVAACSCSDTSSKEWPSGRDICLCTTITIVVVTRQAEPPPPGL